MLHRTNALTRIYKLVQTSKTFVQQQSRRNEGHGEWLYRAAPKPFDRAHMAKIYALGGFLWFWIFYHCATEPEHILGEYPRPDTEKDWSDEHLGVPSDDIGLAPTIAELK